MTLDIFWYYFGKEKNFELHKGVSKVYHAKNWIEGTALNFLILFIMLCLRLHMLIVGNKNSIRGLMKHLAICSHISKNNQLSNPSFVILPLDGGYVKKGYIWRVLLINIEVETGSSWKRFLSVQKSKQQVQRFWKEKLELGDKKINEWVYCSLI